jgi:TP901 family phage tail tape measure protein
MSATIYQFKADLKGLIDLEKKLKIARLELKKLAADTDAYKAKTAQIGTLGKQFNSLNNSMGSATKAAGKMNSAGSRMISTFKSAGVAIASAFAVRAIVGAIRGTIKVFADFEAKMDAVKAISGATGKEFERLRESAVKLGQTTVFTASQVADLQEEFARLGFTADEIRRVQSATLDLAAATGESLAGAAQTAGSVLRAFNYDAEQTQRVTDSMAAAFTGSALNLERFRESMKFVAPVARVAGFTLEETSAALMKLADNGLHGSIAGNALKNIFLKLGDSSSKLSKRLGGTVDNMPDMVAKMKELKKEGFGLTDAVDLLDKRSAPAFLALLNSIESLEPAVKLLNEAEGATSRMAAIRLDNLKGDMTLMQSAMEGLGIAMGEQFDGGLRATIYSLTRWVQSVSQSESKLKLFTTAINVVIAALVALTVRLAAVGLWSFWKGLAAATKGMIALAQSTWAADKSQKALKATMAATPWGAIAQVILTTVTYLIMFSEETDEATQAQKRFNNALQDSLSDIFSHNEASKDRAELMRAFVNDFPELLKYLDLERASNAQLKALKNAMNSQELEGIKEKMANAQAEIDLQKAQVGPIVETQKAIIEANEAIMKSNGNRNSQEYIAAMNEVSFAKNKIRNASQVLVAQENALFGYQAAINKSIADISNAENLQLKEGQTFRKKLNLQYNEDLENFRKMNNSKKELELARQEERLQELELTSAYYNILATQVDKFGKLTEGGAKEAESFLSKLGPEWQVKIKGTKESIQDINIELSEFRKFVSNLDGAIVATAKTLKGPSAVSATYLNQTKENYKALAKIMDDVIIDNYTRLVAAANTHLDVETKKYAEEIDLMKTNIQRMNSIKDSSDSKMLAATIESAKNKYTVIQNLDEQDYQDVISGKKIHLQKMQDLIARMLIEEIEKKNVNNELLIQLEKELQRKLLELKNKEALDKANLEKIYMDSVVRLNETGEISLFAMWNKLRDNRHAKEAADIKFQQAEMDRKESLIFEHHTNVHNDNLMMLMNGEITQAEFDKRRIDNDKDLQNALLKNRQDHQADINEITNNSEAADAALQAQKIQKVGEYYSMAFDAFSTFMNNKFEREMAQINETHEINQQDLSDEMDSELAQAEGNAQAQEAIREKFAERKRVDDAKKDAEIIKVKKKQFMMNKINQIISAVINGAVAITMAAAQTGIGAIAAAPIMSALVGAQIAAIASQQFVGAKGGLIPEPDQKLEFGGVVVPDQVMADGGMVVGKSHSQGGEKFKAGGRVVELEGGEAVINKRSTKMFHSQLSSMNVAGGGKKFQQGGIMPGTSNMVNESGLGNMNTIVEALGRQVVSGVNSKRVTVLEADISSKQENVNILELQSAIL